MKLQYILSIVILTLSIIGAISAYIIIRKFKEKSFTWIKPVIIVCIALFFVSTVFLSIGVATGQLAPLKVIPVFNPNMNGYMESIENSDGGMYTGDFSDGYYHGKGKLTYKDGSTYDGEWNTGKREGIGTYCSAEEWSYSGEWKADKMNGSGTYIYADKSIYVGNFIDDKRSGDGKYTFANGEVYDGNWENDEINGIGKYTYKDGSVYDGLWKC